jgi:hypothetical protein
MRRAGLFAAGAMLAWCVLELGLRAGTGTLGGAGSAIGAGLAAGVVVLALRRAG